MDSTITSKNIKCSELFNQKVMDKIVKYLGSKTTPTPYSRLLNLSGLLTSLQEVPQEQQISIINEETIDVLIGSSRFCKMDLVSFIQKLYLDTKKKLESLLFAFPLEKLSNVLDHIGSERLHNSAIGFSFLEVFKNQINVVFPEWNYHSLLAQHISNTNPISFSTKLEMKTYLFKCNDLLLQLLVLIHVFGGAPPRATELLSVSIENRKGASRNVYVENGTLLEKGY
jgi:hypothetical protein